MSQLKATIVCPECRSAKVDQKLLHCSSCGWHGDIVDEIPVLLSERGKTDPLLNRYTKIYDDIASDDLDVSVMDEEYVQMLAVHTAKMLGGNLAGKKCLDIGAGKGLLVDELMKRGGKVTALDISIAYLKRLKETRKDVECLLANAEEMPFSNAFDVVTCTDVMEHVLNVSNFLYCLNDSLVAGGIAVVRVPYRESLMAYSTYLGCKYDLVHLRNYNEQSLRDCIEGAGFTVERVAFGGYSLSMLPPWPDEEFPQRTAETIKIRSILQNRGVTYSDLDDMPEWFANQISRPYVISVVARKSSRLVPSSSGSFTVEAV